MLVLKQLSVMHISLLISCARIYQHLNYHPLVLIRCFNFIEMLYYKLHLLLHNFHFIINLSRKIYYTIAQWYNFQLCKSAKILFFCQNFV